MKEWYYEVNGERVGPIDGEELLKLHKNGAINFATLVWTQDFRDEWKPFSETDLASSQPNVPPPLPALNRQKILSTTTAEPPADEDFFESELTKVLLGRKQDAYIARWRSILIKAGGDHQKVTQTSSWNWPALFVPYGWLFYRKLYVLGSIAFALQFAYALLPEGIPKSVKHAFELGNFGVCIAVGLYGHSWYFDSIRTRWEKLKKETNATTALLRAKQDGGVNLWAPVIAILFVIVAATLPNLIGGNDPVALVRNGHMKSYPTTTIGQAFDADFVGGQWKSFSTVKQKNIVEFTGKISAVLHNNALKNLLAEPEDTEITMIPVLFAKAKSELAGSAELRELEKKWGCDASKENIDLRGLPTDECASRSDFASEVIDEWSKRTFWPVGTVVIVQWTMNIDGEQFELTHMASDAWKGLQQTAVLDRLFE